MAQAFACKPSLVSVSDDGKIKHNGKSIGKVYRITDRVTTDDIFIHPRSSWNKGWECITKKEFNLEFLYEFSPSPDNILSEDEIRELKKHNASH